MWWDKQGIDASFRIAYKSRL